MNLSSYLGLKKSQILEFDTAILLDQHSSLIMLILNLILITTDQTSYYTSSKKLLFTSENHHEIKTGQNTKINELYGPMDQSSSVFICRTAPASMDQETSQKKKWNDYDVIDNQNTRKSTISLSSWNGCINNLNLKNENINRHDIMDWGILKGPIPRQRTASNWWILRGGGLTSPRD